MIKIFNKSLQEYIDELAKNGLLDKMYDAVSRGTADAVMVAIDIARQLNIKPEIVKIKKDYEKVKTFEILAPSFCNGKELKCYNTGLSYVPFSALERDKHIMANTYYQRAVLLFKLGQTTLSLNDTEKGLALIKQEQQFLVGPYHVRLTIHNLKVLRDKCEPLNKLHKNAETTSDYGIKYFNFKENRNKSIPHASANISIVREDGVPKVVAARDIRIGELVAIEPAFVAVHHNTNRYISCYNCFKFTPSLIPCETCCYAMFCNEACRKQCMEGYHKIECQIMDVLESVATTARCRLSVMTALKIRQMSKSWEDVVTASRTIGTERMKNSSDDEIFDCNNPHSILSYNDDKYLIHGKIFNQSIIFATVIDSLSNIPDYFPTDENEQLEAMHALGRIMLHLYITFPLEVEMLNIVRDLTSQRLVDVTQLAQHHGFFSFASKMKHSCEANLQRFGLHNKLCLIAEMPIKKGTELTMSFRDIDWHKKLMSRESQAQSLNLELACECRICKGENIPTEINLNAEETEIFRRWQNKISLNEGTDERLFKETCDTIQALLNCNDPYNTPLPVELQIKYNQYLIHFLISSTQNMVVLDHERCERSMSSFGRLPGCDDDDDDAEKCPFHTYNTGHFLYSKYLYIADALSRAVATNSDPPTPARDYYETQAQALISIIRKGWPSDKSKLEDRLKCYWDSRDELSVNFGIIWKGSRVVIPNCMRREMLEKIHIGHLGIEKCKLRARETMVGIPEIIMSDNGPEFSSMSFRDFARQWNFDHVTSSPRGYN
ncbi:uncharacterized protein LOC131850227 [Achroia grisella]|uniref:uncharacterized protein LOC131850227 n=1 Tax=Achroia grisella TaxID=688607 RepID=UPI0027D24C90|nr:uncharacterized protein LOC131850227 [Achroia grisella]